MINPVAGRVSSEYSRTRKHPVTGRTLPHLGTDIAALTGTDVLAAFAGKVISVRTGSYKGDARSGAVGGRTGNHVYIQNADGERQYYGHLSKVSVRIGDKVKIGQKIGEVGETGVVTGPHLHFEIHDRNGNTRDPRIDFKHFGIIPGNAGPLIIKPPAAVKPAGNSDYKAWVKNLQRNLNLWKSDLPDLRLDGDYGTATRNRIKDWQRRNKGGAYKGIYIDGDAGPLTTKGLGIANAPKK